MASARTLRSAGVLFASLALVASMAAPAAGVSPANRFTATALKPSGQVVGDFSKAVEKNGKIGVIIRLADESVASYRGGIKGLAATNPGARGARTIDFKSKAVGDYRAYLKTQRQKFAASLSKVGGARITQSWDIAFNGVSARIAMKDVAAVAALPGVAAVYPDLLLKLDTDTSPSFIGATTVWNDLGGQESAGEGVIVGVLDTGIWPEHPSYSDPDPSGKPYAAPPAPPIGTRDCQFSGGANPGPAFTCNNKLIGAMRKMATYDALIGVTPGEFTSARDDDGHGTHTSSTAAGNGGVAATIFGVSRGTISGIAPRAYVEMFKVCGESGCFGSDSVSAVNEAINDGVNVINFSISGGSNPFGDAVELAFRNAYDAGIFVAASAGNSGPGPNTTDHRGPWVTTVGASTHSRAFVNQVQVTADGGASLTLDGISLTAGVGPLAIVVATGDGLCGASTGPYSGEIVICRRGTQGRAEKGFNVLNAGGGGMVLYNQSAAVTDQETDNHYLPASHIQFSQGTALIAFLAAHTGEMATITAGVSGSAQGDVMASFSSRGGAGQSLGISKPDITAPGVQILAGHSPQHVGVAGGPNGELFQAIAGTSMSSPHIAGSGALLKALHPSWTPGQIKSALMTTARTAGLVKEDGSTPFDAYDAGSGRVDLTVAGDPGIAFASTGAQFTSAASHLWDANYPSVFVPSMPGIISTTRRAQDLTGAASIWQLKATGTADFFISVPNKITVPAGGSAAFSITMDASLVPQGQTRFGMIELKQSLGGHRVLHIPVTIVRGQGAVTLTKACSPLSLVPNDVTSCTLTANNPTFFAATYNIKDKLPPKLKLIASSVLNGTVQGKDTVVASGSLPAAQPPDVSIGAGSSPAGGYLPLSLFGIPPIGGVDDDTITNFNVPAFSFAGETWTRLGVSSNGYLVVGGGSGPDNQFLNQSFPNAARPNNVLAAFWSDLNPGAGGAIRIGTLTDGSDTWIVVDWAAVREFSTAGNTHSMEIWIGISGDANPAEDVSYAYGANTGTGDGGFSTVGAENRFGNRGQNYWYNGTGTYPINGTQLRVTTVPGSSSSVVVSFDARAGSDTGSWTNCATMTSDAFLGAAVSCVSGTIAP